MIINRFALVPEVGLEPTRPQWPRDFKSLVSTDSTIQASVMNSAAKVTLFAEKKRLFPFFLSFGGFCCHFIRSSRVMSGVLDCCVSRNLMILSNSLAKRLSALTMKLELP